VRAVIAVASGKGGVGKSTVATNLAVSLAAQGAEVGLIDADIYGPSMPTMLGLSDARPSMTDDPTDPKIIPMTRHGVKVMSMGFMLEADQAVVWRGPMLGKALQQFIDDVSWGPLDYLVIDMPPGTGDVQLSLAQLLPVSGTVVVTTPQDVAFADVRRAIKMLNLTKSPILGLVENMSHFTCDGCGKKHLLFGPSRIEGHAEEHGLAMLGSLPLDTVTALAGDKGEPIAANPDATEQREAYGKLATSVATELTRMGLKLGQPMTAKFQSFFDLKPS
jgi:ATP-binding protein involved in chromosome partitioning